MLPHFLPLTLVDQDQGARRAWLVQAERIVIVDDIPEAERAEFHGAATRITVDCCEGYTFFVAEELTRLLDGLLHLGESG